jgi:hypothetical protein
MLTVIIECRDQETELAQTLSVLVAGAVEGLVSDVAVVDRAAHEGSARVADAAGCRYHAGAELREVLLAARGAWLLLIEPGARPQPGWIDEIAEHIALDGRPARFSPSRNYRPSLIRRLMGRLPPLENGLLIDRKRALAKMRDGMALSDLARGEKTLRLVSEMVPAWAARS